MTERGSHFVQSSRVSNKYPPIYNDVYCCGDDAVVRILSVSFISCIGKACLTLYNILQKIHDEHSLFLLFLWQ